MIGRLERKSRRRKWRGIKFWESLKVKDVWWISWWLWGDVSVCVAIHFNQSITFIISKQNCAKSSSVTDMYPAFIDPYNVITGAKILPLSCQLFQTGSTLANISNGQLVNRFGHTSKLIYNCVFCFVFLNTIFVCTLIKKTWQGNLLACDPPENWHSRTFWWGNWAIAGKTRKTSEQPV